MQGPCRCLRDLVTIMLNADVQVVDCGGGWYDAGVLIYTLLLNREKKYVLMDVLSLWKTKGSAKSWRTLASMYEDRH